MHHTDTQKHTWDESIHIGSERDTVDITFMTSQRCRLLARLNVPQSTRCITYKTDNIDSKVRDAFGSIDKELWFMMSQTIRYI